MSWRQTLTLFSRRRVKHCLLKSFLLPFCHLFCKPLRYRLEETACQPRLQSTFGPQDRRKDHHPTLYEEARSLEQAMQIAEGFKRLQV